MGRVAVIDADPGYESYDQERLVLGQAGYRLDVIQGVPQREEQVQFARGAEGVFVRKTPIDLAFLKALPGLRAMVRYGVGYDNIDLAAASSLGIRVANVQGYANQSVSDHALALLLACARGLVLGHKIMRDQYGVLPFTPMRDLREAVIGIVGLGHIGSTLAGKVKPLFKEVLACDPYVPEEIFVRLGVRPVDLPRLLRDSDAITLHCALTDETRHLLNRDAFAQMTRCPIIVNTSRGPVIDEEALSAALTQGLVRSAGLDVFSEEPPGQRLAPLIDHPLVITTGHYAWYSEQSIEELKRIASQNMVALLRGEIPKDCLNP